MNSQTQGMVAYTRVSTDKEEQAESLENQKIFFEEYGRRSNLVLLHIYADEGISGKSLKKRDNFLRLMEDARNGEFTTVVVKDISRFARNTVDFLQSIRELKYLGVNVRFITANMESMGDSEFILTIFGAVAQEEIVALSRRVKFGKKVTAEKGRVPHTVFGYDYVDNYTLKINEKEADIVREIFRLYVEEGYGCRKLSMRMNEMGCPTKLGLEWDPRTVRRVLRNPIYCGDYVNRKYEIKDCLAGKLVPLPEDQHIHHDRPEWAIVSKETFGKAQEIISERRKKYQNNSGYFTQGRYSDRHLFSTLIRCEECGRAFSRKFYQRKAGRYYYWKCPTNDQCTAKTCKNNTVIPEEELIEKLREYLQGIIGNQEKFLQSVLSDVRTTSDTKNAEAAIKKYEKKITELKEKKGRYQEMYANGVIGMDKLTAKLKHFTDEISELETAIQKLGTGDEKMDTLIENHKRDIIKFLSLENAANIDLRKVIDHISVSHDRQIHIYMKTIKS